MRNFLYWSFLFLGFLRSGSAQSLPSVSPDIRLSPEPSQVAGTKVAILSLNGQWDFRLLAEQNTRQIQVPGEWEMQGFSVGEGETAVYSRPLTIPEDWRGKRIKLRFDGVSTHALVKVNGKEVGAHEGGFVPFELDITDYLKGTANRLTVEVQAGTISDVLACTSQYAAHTVGGLVRDVHLLVLPGVNLSGFHVETDFDAQYRHATLKLYSQITNETSRSAKTALKYTLLDSAGNVVFNQRFPINTIKAGSADRSFEEIKVKAPHRWDPEHPYLYRLVTELIENGKARQVNQQKIGFREVAVSGNLLLVNGQPVKLRGVNRHSIYPLTGRSVSDSLDVEDARLFREANCNYIRTSHYPPSAAFLNACDSLGLFVESESALCWINHGASPIWKLWNYRDEQYLPFMLQANMEKMLADRNHPSVIIWSLGNESLWSPLWAKVNKAVKKLDPTRPTTFHDQCWGGFNNAGSKADIAVYHYPGLNGPGACDTMSRPVLFGEYAHISCYNRLELLTDPGIRSRYGKPLEQMVDSIFAHPANLGGAIWSGIDDIFSMPDGRIIGYGPWGVIDAWRRPKPEYWGVKKAYTPVRVYGVDTPLVEKGLLKIPIENRYDFTDLSEVKIHCKIDGKEIPVALQLAQHTKGVLSIPVQKGTREVYLSFSDPRGFVANEELIRLHKKVRPQFHPLQSAHPVSYTQNSASIFIKWGDLQYEISKIKGVMTRVRKAGAIVMDRGPVFGIVSANGENGGKPTVANESYQNDIPLLRDYSFVPLYASNIEIVPKNKGLVITADIQYMEGKGRQSYHFSEDGTVKVSYKITYNGKEVPRQYGLMLQLPKTYDKIQWQGRGDFSTYPADDIARSRGEARLLARAGKPAEVIGHKPQGSWKDDSNGYGSNDFRATKDNIYTVSLSDGQHYLHIISDGHQAARSWLQDQRIQLLIADYVNNGSEPFYGAPFASKPLQLKDKTLKGSIIFAIDNMSMNQLINE